MRRFFQTHLFVTGVMLLFANHVQSTEFASLVVNLMDLNTLEISEQEFKACSRAKPISYLEVRHALIQKAYPEALKALGKPDNNDSAEHVYLYGKTHYLMAFETVHQGITKQPNAEYLAQAKQSIGQTAKAGYGEAIFDQAMLLTSPADPAKKTLLLRKAAARHYVPAMLTLAEEIFVASGTFEERIEAQSLVQKAAELDTNAKIKLASYYLHEDRQLTTLTGYEKNTNKAIYLLYEAARGCNAVAAYKLKELASQQHKPNRLAQSRAQYWLEASARLGLPAAQGELAFYYLTEGKDQDQAIKWAEQAAAQSDLKALLTLGKIYYAKGINQDLARALKYYEKALNVDRNNRLVQNQLGIMYYKGEGGQVDFRRAASLCKSAASKGQAGCQYYLGLMYVNGEGVTQDIDIGISWMKKSAAQDYSVAKNWLRENW